MQTRLGIRLAKEQLQNAQAMVVQQRNRIIELQQEGKALARALRANQDATRYDSGWIRKKQKKED